MSARATEQATGLADRVIEGQIFLRQMRTSAGLRAAATELAEHADRLGCLELFPSSAHADAIAAVAVALHSSLRVVTLGQITAEHVDKVVVVEAVAVSGFKVRCAVQAVRDAGAHWVSALVLKDLPGDETGSARFGALEQLAVAN